MQLKDQTIDFRDFLSQLDLSIFKKAFVPKKIWRSLGNEYNFKNWHRILTKYRVNLQETSKQDGPVEGEYDEDNYVAKIIILTPKQRKIKTKSRQTANRRPITTAALPKEIQNIDTLKFKVIQTIMHEMVHANQFFGNEAQVYKVIEKQKTEYQNYISTRGEIVAYAHCIALEFLEDGRWGAGTYTWFADCTPKIHKTLHKHIIRWLNMYAKNEKDKY